MGNTLVEYMRSFVVILSLLWLQTQSSLFNALAVSPMRRIYSGLELLLLDCILPRYVNSSTGSTVLPSTIIGDGVGPEPRFWIFVLVQGHISTKFDVCTDLRFWVNWRHRTDKETDIQTGRRTLCNASHDLLRKTQIEIWRENKREYNKT